jgi:hypothetical protein
VRGSAGINVGRGERRRDGDPGTLRIFENSREALIGDLLLDEQEPMPPTFLPRAPDVDVDGRIIAVVDGISLVGRYQVVVLNRGDQHGLEAGHVLRAFRTGEVVDDTVRRGRGSGREKVRLPDEPSGTIMVFRSYDRMSYALVMESNSELQVLDSVRNP